MAECVLYTTLVFYTILMPLFDSGDMEIDGQIPEEETLSFRNFRIVVSPNKENCFRLSGWLYSSLFETQCRAKLYKQCCFKI
jgi:hypothetical protein